jgi:cell division protein FtsL
MLRRWMPFWTIPVLILMATGTVWLRLWIVRATYGISQSEKTIHHLQQEVQQMELKVTALRSPRRLELLAKTKFNLSQPHSDQVVRLGMPTRASLGGVRVP